MKNMFQLAKLGMKTEISWYHNSKKPQLGFTLIEVMIVVIIIAILAAIAIPAYTQYTRKAVASTAEQEMLRIAEQLERYKAKNFTYKGFDPNYIYGQTAPMEEIILPRNATGTGVKYTLTIQDPKVGKALTSSDTNVRGRNWAIKAESSDIENYHYLMTSDGVRCKSKDSLSTYTSCPGSEVW